MGAWDTHESLNIPLKKSIEILEMNALWYLFLQVGVIKSLVSL